MKAKIKKPVEKPNGAGALDHPAVDSNAAAKANGGIRLDPEMAFRLGGLLADLRAAEAKYRALDKELAQFLQQCAASKGIKLEEYELHMDTMSFLPRTSLPKFVVQ